MNSGLSSQQDFEKMFMNSLFSITTASNGQ